MSKAIDNLQAAQKRNARRVVSPNRAAGFHSGFQAWSSVDSSGCADPSCAFSLATLTGLVR
jgi:hypothetical protein